MRTDSNEVSFPELVQLISKSENSHKRIIGTLKPEDDNKFLSNRMAIGFSKAHQLERDTMQPTQDARVKACKYPLMSYMWYLINYTLARNISPCCKWNADACTSFFVGRPTF